jgi:hypothetical protein
VINGTYYGELRRPAFCRIDPPLTPAGSRRLHHQRGARSPGSAPCRSRAGAGARAAHAHPHRLTVGSAGVIRRAVRGDGLRMVQDCAALAADINLTPLSACKR